MNVVRNILLAISVVCSLLLLCLASATFMYEVIHAHDGVSTGQIPGKTIATK